MNKMDKKEFNKLIEKRNVPKAVREAINLYYDDWSALAEILDVKLIIKDVNPDNLCDIKFRLENFPNCPTHMLDRAYGIFRAVLGYQMEYDACLGLMNAGFSFSDNLLVYRDDD